MSDRKIELTRLEITNPEDPDRPGKTTLDVVVYYDLGGPNYFTDGNSPRGYYLRVSPITRRDSWNSYVGFSGVKILLQAADRFSQKVLEQVAATALQHEMYPKVLAAVVAKGNFVLADQTPPTP